VERKLEKQAGQGPDSTERIGHILEFGLGKNSEVYIDILKR
jgi:hypothetical protein